MTTALSAEEYLPVKNIAQPTSLYLYNLVGNKFLLSYLVSPFLTLLLHCDIAKANLRHQVNALKGTKQHF